MGGDVALSVPRVQPGGHVQKRLTVILIPSGERVSGRLKGLPGPWDPSLSSSKEWAAVLPRADPARAVAAWASLSSEEPPCAQDRGLAALGLTSLIRVACGQQGRCALWVDQVAVVITPRRRASCRGQVRDSGWDLGFC